MKPFTLHVRLTRSCQASCNYCSSAGFVGPRMSADTYLSALDFIAEKLFPRLRIGTSSFLAIEYLGGEILLLPPEEFERAVTGARERLAPLVGGFRDGAQSNLATTPRRAIFLHDLFDGRIGTSWDRHSDQRQIAGSSALYRQMLDASLTKLAQERNSRPGRVLVLDRATAPFLVGEVTHALEEGYDLVIRPVFQGGSPDTDPLLVAEMTRVMRAAYHAWRGYPDRRIEPFYSLYHRRAKRGTPAADRLDGCPFQTDCATRSLSLDPDGSFHICQEMADAGHYPLGNAIEKRFEARTWRLLARRRLHLSAECSRCPWLSECGGGCMNEAIEHHGDPFARTELCPVWKALFIEIEKDLGLLASPDRPSSSHPLQEAS